MSAQQIKKNAKIKQDEVPTAVRVSFESDFGKIPEDGSWNITFYVINEGSKTVAKPIWYTYLKEANPKKLKYDIRPKEN